MNVRESNLAFAVLCVILLTVVNGCSKQGGMAPGKTPGSSGSQHTDGEHQDADDKEADHQDRDHQNSAFKESDVKMPTTFARGVSRLEELNETIEHHIAGDMLADAHRIAEEMALIAKGMKELARNDLPEDQQTEAGRLCNEVAGYYSPIDEAAEAGKKPETEAIHKQLTAAIAKLRGLFGHNNKN